jgi:hypothetical protein
MWGFLVRTLVFALLVALLWVEIAHERRQIARDRSEPARVGETTDTTAGR